MNPFSLNPEAGIAAVNAANIAKEWAQMAAFSATMALIMLFVIGALVIYVAVRFHLLEKHTNSIMDRLLKVSGEQKYAAGSVAGEAAGRAAERAHEEEQIKAVITAKVEKNE